MTGSNRKAARDEFPPGSWVRPPSWSVWHLATWDTQDMRLLNIEILPGKPPKITGDGGWNTACGRLFLGRRQTIPDGLNVSVTEPDEGRCGNCIRVIGR